MFRVNRDGGTSGVTLTFANGASLSIQSSTSHMCTPGSSVEIHAWGPKRARLNLQGRKDIVGWVRMDDLPKFINKVKRWKPKEVQDGA
jgi:hypothetical protein